ncbi:MAG: SGNH/GDSL hydrolase family protein [Acidobacteriota bacterium]
MLAVAVLMTGAYLHPPPAPKTSAQPMVQLQTGDPIPTARVPEPPFTSRVARSQLVLTLSGLALAVLAALAPRSAFLSARLGTDRAAKVALLVASSTVPLLIAEMVLRPFVHGPRKETRLFVADEVLGWRMRPNVEELWGGVIVRTNGRGLRGPDVAMPKPKGTARILYLGDSVTFGYMLERDEDTYVAQAESLLKERLGRPVDSVNSGVGGYSEWQELAYLQRDGLALEPDAVVLGFVLNDVTEKLELYRYGGFDEGFALRNSYSSWLDRLQSEVSLLEALHRLKVRSRYGSASAREAKKKEALTVPSLIYHPGDPCVREAWKLTLPSIEKIYDACHARHIPVLLVVFPYTFQFRRDAGDLLAPQAVLREHAAAHGVPFLDLYPAFVENVDREGGTARDLFFDYNHPNARGFRVTAQAVAEVLARELAAS